MEAKIMDKTVCTILVVLALIIGLTAGFSVGEAQEIETIVEVPVEGEPYPVPGENITIDTTPDYFGDAESFFLEEVEDTDRLLRCDGHEYDFEDISVSKVYDERTLTFDDDELTVDFKIKLVYDEDDSRSCRKTFYPSVFYEEDEEPELSFN